MYLSGLSGWKLLLKMREADQRARNTSSVSRLEERLSGATERIVSRIQNIRVRGK